MSRMLARSSHGTQRYRILISVVIVTPQTTGLRVDDELSGLLILGSHHLEVPPLSADQHVGPSVGHHLLTYLVLRDRSVFGDEDGSAVTFFCKIDCRHDRYQHRRHKHRHEYSVGHGTWLLIGGKQSTRALRQP